MIKNLVDFLAESEKLKITERYGTCKPELRDSVADHSWKLGLMVIFVAETLNIQLNVPHAVELALVHDLQEYIAGEIDSIRVARGEVTKEQKRQLEESAIKDLASRFPVIGSRISDLWYEFEGRKTQEARYVVALDKIESLIHLFTFADRGRNYDDADHIAFYADDAVLEFPELKPMLREVKVKLKETYKQGGFEWKPEYDRV